MTDQSKLTIPDDPCDLLALLLKDLERMGAGDSLEVIVRNGQPWSVTYTTRTGGYINA